ncbi:MULTISPECIES: hypothetical protein [Amycolatopsis]|uniref:hypothetical protein n=1 Tax=Amycolatopsis TaxID=1813 RepID=UPI0018E9524F|nr:MULTISPECIES: hypothetical protein [Amycolatopsis]
MILHPAAVAERATVSALVAARHAVAGVNGITPTGSSVGPARRPSTPRSPNAW